MRIASRFPIAVHILSLLGLEFPVEATSVFMARSIGVNPVIVRNITGMLRRAGLVTCSQGVAGAHLAKPPEEITLLDVYRAVDLDGDLFAIHEGPHPDCPAGAHIQGVLDGIFSEAQRAMETRLARTTMRDVVESLRQLAGVAAFGSEKASSAD